MIQHRLIKDKGLIANHLSRASTLIALLISATLMLLMLTRAVWIPQTYAESPIITWHSFASIVIMTLSTLSCLSIAFLLRNISPKALFTVCSISFSLAALYLLNQYSGYPRADAGAVFSAMERVQQEDVSSFLPGGYMHLYPHQIGLMHYYLIGKSLFGGHQWIYYANLAWALLGNCSIWQIVRNSKHSSTFAENFSILLPIFFLPHLLFTLYGYNHGPSLAFAIFGIFCLQSGLQKNNYYYFLASIIALSLAVTIRQNYQILIIAVVLALL